MDPAFLKLPAQIQIALASGYAAYMASTYGARAHHSATDTGFRTLLYGLIASGMLAIMPRDSNPIVGGVIAFTATMLIGLLWRTKLCKLWNALMRHSEVTFSDDSPSAWAAMSANAECYVSQISVTLDDDTTLVCENTSEFAGAPFGPCVLGNNGDVALYVTNVKRGAEVKQQTSVRNTHYGDRITWVPAAKIKRLTLRHLPK